MRCFGKEPPESIAERSSWIGSVHQDPQVQIIFPEVEDELAFPLENLGCSTVSMERIVKQQLQWIQLPARAKTKTLSGGEAQKVVCAATLGMDAPILLLDEPLAALDVSSAHALLRHLQQLARKGKTILIIEHRLEIVLDYVDAALWLEEGMVRYFPKMAAFSSFYEHWLQQQLVRKETIKNGAAEQKERRRERTGASSEGEFKGEEPLLQLKNVHFQYGERALFSGLSFVVYAGDRHVIQGENGCGKTTLLQLMAGFLQPAKGKMQTSFSFRKRWLSIAYVLQNPSAQLFLPTVREELAFHQSDADLCKYLIHHFALQDLLERHPQSLSEGQKRRLGFVLALCRRPRLLLLDEPTVGQDYRNMWLMLEALHTVDPEGQMAMITITHDQRCARYLGDHYWCLEEGQLKKKSEMLE